MDRVKQQIKNEAPARSSAGHLHVPGYVGHNGRPSAIGTDPAGHDRARSHARHGFPNADPLNQLHGFQQAASASAIVAPGEPIVNRSFLLRILRRSIDFPFLGVISVKSLNGTEISPPAASRMISV